MFEDVDLVGVECVESVGIGCWCVVVYVGGFVVVCVFVDLVGELLVGVL